MVEYVIVGFSWSKHNDQAEFISLDTLLLDFVGYWSRALKHIGIIQMRLDYCIIQVAYFEMAQ